MQNCVHITVTSRLSALESVHSGSIFACVLESENMEKLVGKRVARRSIWGVCSSTHPGIVWSIFRSLGLCRMISNSIKNWILSLLKFLLNNDVFMFYGLIPSVWNANFGIQSLDALAGLQRPTNGLMDSLYNCKPYSYRSSERAALERNSGAVTVCNSL